MLFSDCDEVREGRQTFREKPGTLSNWDTSRPVSAELADFLCT